MRRDTAGRPLTPLRVERALNLNIVVGCLGICWGVALFPGSAILTLYLSEELHASFTQIGLLTSVASIAALFQLPGVLLFNRLRTRKRLWAVCTLIVRTLGFAVAATAVYVARGGDTATATWAVIAASALGMVFANLVAVGWWGWMADLVPEAERGRFFGRRQAVLTAVQMVFFILVTVGLDSLQVVGGVLVFGTIFAVGALLGVIDIAVHSTIPEPMREDRPEALGVLGSFRHLVEPLRNRGFVVYLVTISAWVFATSVLNPFVAPYLKASTDTGGLGVPYWFFALLNVIASVTGLLTARAWGVVADRFGNRPVLQITALSHALSGVYFFVTPANATLVLSISTCVSGILVAGWILASGNMMLGMAPTRNRSSYLAWNAAFVGIGGFLGPRVGGWLGDWAADYLLTHPWTLPGGHPMAPIHILVAVSWFFCLLAYPVFGIIREPRARSVGFVVGLLTGGNLFRTFSTLGLITSRASAERKARALRRMGGQSDLLAVGDVLARLDDPDETVRREAALALGRIPSRDAVDPLLHRLTDPDSDLKNEAAIALGTLRAPRAIDPLIAALDSPDPPTRRAAATALGEFGAPRVVEPLMQLLETDPEPRVFVAALRALSRLGEVGAAWEVLPRMHETRNNVLRRELAVCVADLVGAVGEFYRILHGESRVPGSQVVGLLRLTRRRLTANSVGVRPREGRSREGRSRIRRIANDAIGAFEAEDHERAGSLLWDLFVALLERNHGYRAATEDLALGFAARTDLRLGVGAYLIHHLSDGDSRNEPPELVRLDFLLAAYFLACESGAPSGRRSIARRRPA